MNATDTIVAISSAVGPAPRIIVRLSGRDSHSIARSICNTLPDAGGAMRTHLRVAGMIVPAWACPFAEGKSYTGEASVEFHIPGNALLARMLLDEFVRAGARQAEAGEFTARAYFSGRMSLTQAEGVAATIAAHSEQELRAARQLMSGELSRRLQPAMDLLMQTLALVEAGIDFSDEDISFITAEQIAQAAGNIDAMLDELVQTSARFEALTHEPTFVLVGRPNAGKSTLLNALAGHERAIVSPMEGTTRDVLSAEVRLHRGLIRLIDVAGLGGVEESSENVPEGGAASILSQMQAQAKRALASADRVVLVRDVSDVREPIKLDRPWDLEVRSKIDLSPGAGGAAVATGVSAVTGAGMSELGDQLDRLAFGETSQSGSALALNARHLRNISESREALVRARTNVQHGAGVEIIALDLREALDALGGVLGQVTPDDVLGRVFSTFCIGK